VEVPYVTFSFSIDSFTFFFLENFLKAYSACHQNISKSYKQ